MPSNWDIPEGFADGTANVITPTKTTILDNDGSSKDVVLASAQGYVLQILISSESISLSACSNYDNLKKLPKYLNNGWLPAKTWFVNNGFVSQWNNCLASKPLAATNTRLPTKNNSSALWCTFVKEIQSIWSLTPSLGSGAYSPVYVLGGKNGRNDQSYSSGEDNTAAVIYMTGSGASPEVYSFDDDNWDGTYVGNNSCPVCFVRSI